MKKEITITRKVSAIVALALAVLVTFTAALDSFGESKIDPLLMMEIKASEQAAYDSLFEDEFLVETAEENLEIIKIYDAQDNLISEVSLTEEGVIKDKEIQKLVNRAEYLTEFNNTSVYIVID